MAAPFAATDALVGAEVQSKESNFLAQLRVFGSPMESHGKVVRKREVIAQLA
jgi:hypothetical protein